MNYIKSFKHKMTIISLLSAYGRKSRWKTGTNCSNEQRINGELKEKTVDVYSATRMLKTYNKITNTLQILLGFQKKILKGDRERKRENRKRN